MGTVCMYELCTSVACIHGCQGKPGFPKQLPLFHNFPSIHKRLNVSGESIPVSETAPTPCLFMFRPVVPKLFIVPYPFKHSTSSCVPPLAPGSAHSQMLFFAIIVSLPHTHYTIHLLNIRMSVSFCHNPARGK